MAIPTRNTEVFYIEDHLIRSHYVTEIYVPQVYLEYSKMLDTGTTYSVLGILPYSVFIDGKEVFSNTLKIPQVISINIPDRRNDLIKISPHMEEPIPVVVLTFQPTEPITSEYTEADVGLANIIMDMFLGGNIPPTISYWDINNLIQDTFKLNELNISVPSFIVEDMVATLYRSAKNPEHKFARDIGNDPTINPLSYRAMSSRNVTRYISTFAGVSSEVMGESLLYGIKRSKEGKEEPTSPIESTIYA